MKNVWQLQNAKSRLSEVVAEAQSSGPQVITRHGTETAVLLSYADYRKLLGEQRSLALFFRESPLCGVEIDLARDQSPPREIDLQP